MSPKDEPDTAQGTGSRSRPAVGEAPAAAAEPVSRPAGDPGFGGPRAAADIGFLRAMRTHWIIVLLTLTVFVGAAVAVGLTRQPVYTSDVNLNVSFTAESVATQPGAVDAAQNLAESYARSLLSTEVIDQVARQTNRSSDQVSDSISATPVTDSTVLFVSAEANSERGARQLSDATAQALVDYVDGLGSSRLRETRLFERYQEASRRYEELRSQRDEAEEGNGDASVDLETQLAEAELERDTYAGLYRGTQRPVVAPLEILDDSREASSDFLPRLQLLVLAGLVGGLLSAAALASLRAARLRRRNAANG